MPDPVLGARDTDTYNWDYYCKQQKLTLTDLKEKEIYQKDMGTHRIKLKAKQPALRKHIKGSAGNLD